MMIRSLLFLIGLLSLGACDSQSGADADRPVANPTLGRGANHGSETTSAQTHYEDLSAEAFAQKLNEPNTVLLDVRTPAEIARGKIEGALELDYRSPTFAAELAKLDPNKTYLVYCAVGGRSGKACGMLDELGAKEVYNLAGGYGAWPK